MVGLDVTYQTVMSPAYVESLKSVGNKYTNFITQILPLLHGLFTGKLTI